VAIGLMLDQPDTVLDEAGFSLVHLCRSQWESLVVDGVAYEPVSRCVLLKPDFGPQDTLAAAFRTDSTGVYSDQPMARLGGRRGLVQAVAGATGPYWLESHREYPRDQGFVLWFCLYEPAPDFLGVQALTFRFGGRYAVRVTSDGAALLRAEQRAWRDGAEPTTSSYAGLVWREVASGPVFEDGSHLAGAWHRLLVLPLKRDQIVVKGGETTGFCFTEPDILETATGGEEMPKQASMTFRAPVRLEVDGGAFLASLSTPRYATSGSVASPDMRLSYTATSTPVAEVRWEPKPDASASIRLLASTSGGPLALPADRFAYRVDLAGSAEHPTAVYDAEVRFAPTTRQRGPGALDASQLVLEARESAALRSESARLSLLLDARDDALGEKADRCNMRVEFAVDGVRRFTGLSGASVLEPGRAARLALACDDLTKRLRTALLSDERAFDGMVHTEAVRELLHLAGFADEDLEIAEDDYRLPARANDDMPLLQPRNGESVATFLEYLRESFSGWRAGFDRGGVFHYAPPPEESIPVASFSTQTTPAGEDAPVFELEDQIDETGHANEVHVIGRGPTGEVLSASFVDYASQNDPTSDRYVGERRLLVWVDTALATQSSVNWVCRTLAEEAIRLHRAVSFSGPFLGHVSPGDAVALDGETHIVHAMATSFLPHVARTRYTCEPA
jgi:hypothetical protein